MDVPSEAPHKVAGKGLDGIKKLPPWALILGFAIFVLLVLMMRHKSAAAATSSQDASAASTDSTDPNALSTDQSGLNNNNDYLAGYDAGEYSAGGLSGTGAGGALPSDIYGGAGQGGALPNPTGASTAPSESNLTINFPTGGGAPNRPTNVHKSQAPKRHPAKKAPPARTKKKKVVTQKKRKLGP